MQIGSLDEARSILFVLGYDPNVSWPKQRAVYAIRGLDNPDEVRKHALYAGVGSLGLALIQGASMPGFRTGPGFAVSEALSEGEMIAARQTVAREFYRRAGWTEGRIAEHLKGIDFTKSVDVVTLPKGTTLVQYNFPGGRTGNYFALPGTPANQLGIYTNGRVESVFLTTQPLNALRSTTANAVDTWSVPGTAINASGGATQLVIPKF